MATRTVSGRNHALLHAGWVIANHILVSFHVAFISSILALPATSLLRDEVLRFVFLSPETLISALFVCVSFHTGIALHELGHFLTAARLNALSETLLEEVKAELNKPWYARLRYYLMQFLRIPYGKAVGIKREGLNYYPDAPYNLAVAAAGPRASRNAALLFLPLAIVLIAWGVASSQSIALYIGRLFLGISVVCLLDFCLADPGKYAAFRRQEKRAADRARSVEQIRGWVEAAAEAKHRMLQNQMQKTIHPRLGMVSAPWQFRNCGMGGRHTEKEYPESNISMQEAMFLILGARDYLEAQEMTVRLQNRLKEIIEKEEGCRVMGIGLEGGLAPYVERGTFPLPEVRLWAMMKQAIMECGFQPGRDVAIALDPAMSELENAYREEFEVPDAIGTYLFWRDKAKVVLDRDAVCELYQQAMQQYEIPLLSIEDGFAEDDEQGWSLLLERLGERIFVIGDDLITTNDQAIETAADQRLINTVLIKANQIGTLYETLLAVLVALGKGLEVVVSHRSKSPNDDMEAQIALAVNALGLKAGGGSNTERLVKYQAVTEQMLKVSEADARCAVREGDRVLVQKIRAYEESTNAGIPTVGVTVELVLPESGVLLEFRGATPLGTSAGSREAIHLVDTMIERAEHREVIDRHGPLFKQVEPGVSSFAKDLDERRIRATGDEELLALYRRAQRYGGKGCLNAVENVLTVIAPCFEGCNAAALSLRDLDRALLGLELRTARRRGKLATGALSGDGVQVMQRKQNLGMNAILSVSLALARAVAHIRGRQLYELLREELLTIIEHVAARFGIPIEGSQFADYVAALRRVTRAIEEGGGSLCQVLREHTGIYEDTEGTPALETSTSRGPAAKEEDHEVPEALFPAGREAATGAPVRSLAQSAFSPGRCEQGPSLPALAPTASPPRALPGFEPEVPLVQRFTAEEREALSTLNKALFDSYWRGNRLQTQEALRLYFSTKAAIARHFSNFGFVNNHLLKTDGQLIAPYLVGDTIIIYAVNDGGERILANRRFPRGQIFTDRLVEDLCGVSGAVVDLEPEIMVLDVDQAESFHVARLRDIAALLERVNESVNRNAAVYQLRYLVSRLCNLSLKAMVRAKNLRPEVTLVTRQVAWLLNGRLGARLPLLMRILVRNLSILVGRPNLIDRVWNDTIALAEVHLRGSAIVNELRRSSHHALGRRTLVLAEAYLDFLQTGDHRKLAGLGFDAPAPADLEARHREKPLRIVERVVDDLRKLLGSSETITRIKQWQETYSEALLQGELGNRIETDLETFISKGIRTGNRWVYFHHLRLVREKARSFSEPDEVVEPFHRDLDRLDAMVPDGEGFDAALAERTARAAVAAFVDGIQRYYREELFAALDAIMDRYARREFLETATMCHELRDRIHASVERGGFPEQRYLLLQLDCLLEEMGYLALRQIATRYRESVPDLVECRKIIRLCVLNLEFDGLVSCELGDLAAMLVEPGRDDAELLNVLESIERCYHRIRQRVTVPYEKMRHRLGLSEDELRTVLANMQRYMHDLNSMVHFSNIAETALRKILAGRARKVPVEGGERPPADEAIEVIHISHREHIAARINEREEGRNLRALYGGKGSGLLYISYMNIPTRDGFILPTSVTRSGLHERDPGSLQRLVAEHLATLEQDIGTHTGVRRRFGDTSCPLLLAVRGGSVFSMPGILSTVVFVGMNDRIAEVLAQDGPWGAYDSYRRFLASYSLAAWGIDLNALDLVEEAKRRYGVSQKTDLPWEAMRRVAEDYKAVLRDKGFGRELDEILERPEKQLFGAISAVWKSWAKRTASRYREITGICDSWHTAVIVQEMAFGNRANAEIRLGMDETSVSLTGVIPHTVVTEQGTRQLTGEFKFSAAGDDLVEGVIAQDSLGSLDELRDLMPMLHRRLRHIVAKLRRLMGMDQEIEFTVDRGVLSVLQTRTAASASDQAPDRFVEPGEPIAMGLGVRGGGFRGIVAFDDADLQEMKGLDRSGRDDVDGILMVLENPIPDDIPVIISADGLLTAKGGSTSHAAVAVNSIEDRHYSAVMSASGLRVNAKKREALFVDERGNVLHCVRKGDILSIHGTSGEVYIGTRELARPLKEETG
ncbi:MAG: PEP/pyruvate-binding domain-containing protein [Planctomycetota bacterium]